MQKFIRFIRRHGKAWLPYGFMVWWLKKRYCVEIDRPFLHYRGFAKILRRAVKWSLPFYVVMRVRHPYYGAPPPPARNCLSWSECKAWGGADDAESLTAKVIDVIVPVYNGMQFLPRLFESIGRTKEPFRLIVVNDCSPDTTVRPFLEAQKAIFKNCIIIDNDENLGFVRSVNKALRLAENDVAIVNTDVELPTGWLERLMRPILMSADIASATPFTNSGTICSFPKMLEDNALFEGLSVEQIDAAFKGVKPRYQEVPTGVGFCMGMKRSAIVKVGLFDEETFYKGYGEENDWCQRAIAAGYKNVIVENLFVYHKHGGSFTSEAKQKYLQRNGQIIGKRYPNYEKDVAAFINLNPHKHLREYLKYEICKRCAKASVVIFDHSWGGGANIYSDKMRDGFLQNDYAVYRVVQNVMDGLVVEFCFHHQLVRIGLDSIDEILEVVGDAYVEHVIVSDQDKLCGSETERYNQLLEISERLRRENREMLNSKSWRITQPLRSVMLRVRESRWYSLVRKFKENLRKNGIRWTLRKVYIYVVVNRGKSEYEARLPNRECLHFVLTEELLSRVCCASDIGDVLREVTVVVPVYNGLEHLKRLVPGLLANTPKNVPLMFIDDASSDEKVCSFLDDLAARHRGRVSVVRHHKNCGFVKSVNEGLKKSSGDVIILNSDTEVPPRWVERLYAARTPNTASVTPFSNAAALVSFPSREGNNRSLIENIPCERIDRAFQTLSIKPELRHAPSGVGFCMLMIREAVDKVGLFDEKSFEKGYGEEVDWCIRAFNCGFDNVIASNLFVAHYDGGSFTARQKTVEAFEHEKILSLKHPDFHGRHYLAHLEKIEPYWELIRNMAALRLFTQPEFKPLIVIGNHLTGGSADFLHKYDQLSDRSVICFRPLDKKLSVDVKYRGIRTTFETESMELLFHRNLLLSTADIIVNHFLKWELYFGDTHFSPETYRKVVNLVTDLKKRTGAKLHFMFHDFFAVCPSYTLLDSEDRFCHPDKDTERCKQCVARLSLDFGIFSKSDIDRWRKEAGYFFAACDEIRFFSENTKSIVAKVFNLRAEQMTVVPHEPLIRFKSQNFPRNKNLTVGVVGGINKCKGENFLNDFALYLKQRDPAASIVIIGETDHPPYPDNVIVHGRYTQSELPTLLEKYQVNIGFIASIWPETFSYVTQELMMLGLPLVCFDIGAPRDRIVKYPKGAVIREISCECAYETIEKLRHKLIQ